MSAATDSLGPGLWSQPVIIWPSLISPLSSPLTTEISRHKGVQRDLVHDFIPGHDAGEALESDCCDCYKGPRMGLDVI